MNSEINTQQASAEGDQTEECTSPTDKRIDNLEANAVSFFDVFKISALVSVLALALFFVAATYIAPHLKLGQLKTQVVYLDFERVMNEAIKVVADKGHLSIQETTVDAEKFQQQISLVLAEYSGKGYLVLNRRALIEASPDGDITPAVLARLGLQGVR